MFSVVVCGDVVVVLDMIGNPGRCGVVRGVVCGVACGMVWCSVSVWCGEVVCGVFCCGVWCWI